MCWKARLRRRAVKSSHFGISERIYNFGEARLVTTTIFAAKRIITMNPSRPFATHVAVRDGRVLGVGTLEEVSAWGDANINDRFSDQVVLPGLIEGHSHLVEGALWDHAYVGYYDRTAPDGRVWPGLKSLDAVVERLQEARPRLMIPIQHSLGGALIRSFLGSNACTPVISTVSPMDVASVCFMRACIF